MKPGRDMSCGAASSLTARSPSWLSDSRIPRRVRSASAAKIASSSSSEYLTIWFSIRPRARLCQAPSETARCGYHWAMLRFIGLSLLLVIAGAAVGQSYPSQPIRLIAPFPPGGSVDITARLIADPLASQLGGRIIIENRTGASGNIGMEAAARAAPDGYTLVINTIPLVTNLALFDKLT